MKKTYVAVIFIMIVLSACSTSTPAPTAAPATTVPPTVVMPTATPTPPVDENTWYKMSNKSIADMAVDIWNDGNNGVALVKPGDYSGQYWRFISWGDGTYKVTNAFLQDKKLQFDLFTEGKNTRVFMAPMKDTASQHWTVVALGNGAYQIKNASLGDGLSLDVNKENKLVLTDNSSSDGQVWKLDSLGAIN